MLESINSPKDLKGLDYESLALLSGEIREEIINTVSQNGGHLASNLGMVEATIALHRVFDTPKDKIIFDVSHQCYAHKLLTGRKSEFATLRKFNGLSGFTNPSESEYDTVYSGHSGTSISTALGIACASNIKGDDAWAVAVIGDGSFTNGMAYEALNNCGNGNLNLIILLNDNEMSISKNVGGMHHSLSTIRTSTKYFAFKRRIRKICSKIPFVGNSLVVFARSIRDLIKRITTNYNIFESLGCDYIGPVDGNNIKKLEDALKEAKTKNRCTVVHIITKKGKGYPLAEEKPEIYHSTSAFDKDEGVLPVVKTDFSSEFGKYMCKLAQEDKRICAITAAMADGTGLREFSSTYSDRFFDTAIAEEHSATFSAGLALASMKPVFAVYSTFSQRIYDQLSHDAALQKLPLVIAIDRAGIVGTDGATHQGIYDYSLFSSIPGIRIFSPETYSELRECLDDALSLNTLTVVRYPRGGESKYDRSNFVDLGGLCAMGRGKPDAVIITYGRITDNAYYAALMLEKLNIHTRIIKLVEVFPLNKEKIIALTDGAKLVYVLEEGIKAGSAGEKITSMLSENGFSQKCFIRAIDNDFVAHGSREQLLKKHSLDAQSVAREIYNLLK